ncbi:MAG: diaminopimelate epimerase [Bacteroidaceae bacterium]|nr:diaminopimelate epimerase [Bacteroidaceae bacterium]
MKRTIHFTKMHGAGNDYIYVNTLLYNIPDPSAVSIEWSKPHFGIGSDGLILIGAPTRPDADFSMRIFNNDGSEAMMCGNGTRCVAKFLHDKGVTDKNPIRLETLSGIKVLQLHLDGENKVDAVTVDMGEPILRDPKQFTPGNGNATDFEVTVDGRTFVGTFVSMGNPHFVIFLHDDVEQFPLAHYGALLEHADIFPQRCNIEFAQVVDEDTFRMRVWERGSGITLACGTGACATAVAAHLTGRAGRMSNIQMDGGTLQIHWNEADNHILMTGPAAITFEGEISL